MDNRIKNLIKKHGLAGVNRPKKTPSHPTKKGIVLAKEGDRVKLIRFGDQNMGHNYSPEARKSFKSRHAKNIAKGKMSAAYWADKAFWGGPGADKKMPPKSQEYTRGLKKYADGGKVSQRPSYDEWKKKYNLKETDDYKLKEAYDLGYNPDKKTGHLPSINYKTGEFLKSGRHESVRKELDWYNSKEGARFRAKNKIDSSGPYWKYVPKYADGGKVAAKKNTFPYTPPQKPASGKLEYVPLVETLTGVDRIGGGLFSKAAGKLIKKGADYARNYVRLKTNPTSAYRMLGTKGHKSAKKEGFLTPSPYDKSLGKTHTKTAYSIGSPADGKYNKFHRKYEGPYMVEVKNATTNPKFHKTLSDKEAYTAPVSPEKYGGGGGHIPISEAILWKKTPLGGYRKVKFANGGKIATKTNPSLWEKAKAQAKARMGGKHSARAMQLAVSIYKKAGGGYKGPKKETGLSKWTKQDWTTSSGKPSEGKRRYLPRKAWSALSSAEKAATNRAKAEGNKQGKQFVAQPKTIAKKVVKYRR